MYCLKINIKNGHSHFKNRSKPVKKIWVKRQDHFNRIHRAILFKPAVEHFDGEVVYYYHGEVYDIKETENYVETTVGGLRNSMKNNSPAVVYKNGTKEWYRFDKLHRSDDLPAVEYSNGDKEWRRFGQLHRWVGPAVILGDKQYWFLLGEFINQDDFI
ncbi:MAG: hypothetical protein EKK64_04965 [Neisseriaceae bacterium]|nr:MAG: hypothetical protein EKK64_04965 [Neisseriaceae bacterium]